MNKNAHVSPEIDRQVHQAVTNIANLRRYRSQRQLLEQKKDELTQKIMSNFAERVTVQRLSLTIRCAKQQLTNGRSFEEAYNYARILLTDTPA